MKQRKNCGLGASPLGAFDQPSRQRGRIVRLRVIEQRGQFPGGQPGKKREAPEQLAAQGFLVGESGIGQGAAEERVRRAV